MQSPAPSAPRRARRWLAGALLATVFACATTATAIAQPAGPSAADVVTGAYRQIAWQAVLEHGGGPGLLDQPASRLASVFDPALTALVLRQQRCQARAQGACALDFDPFWDSQDPLGTTVAVAPGPRPGEVAVQLRSAGGQLRQLRVQLVQTPDGWRIADIHFGGRRPSLKALLAQNP